MPAWAEPTGELGAVADDVWFAHNPYAEWYANTIRINGSPAQAHHARAWASCDYDAFLDLWKAKSFDAERLMEDIRASGARYVVPTTKHHDGIALWNAPGTGARNVVHRGPRRDLVEEMAKAARGEGLRFGVYYSGGLDCHHSPTAPIRTHAQMYGTRPINVAYACYAFRHVDDLIRRYRPDILWNDIEWPDAGKANTPFGLPELFRRYVDTVPDGVVNDRWGVPFADFATSEYQAHRDRESGLFEHTRGIGLSFGYNAVESDEHLLRGDDLIRYFVDVVARGGNLLLNVGPTAEGTLPATQRTVLRDLGAWLDVNGEAIYGSRPAPKPFAAANDPWVRWTAKRGSVFAFVDAGTGPARVRCVTDLVDWQAARAVSRSPAQLWRVDHGFVADFAATGIHVLELPLRSES
ncbi:alpha-L-fucosidase [Microbacterium sp. AK009]|nr:alpha-L-fucosidase [Microbacterium sp. AK009]